ncbi:hypothetical protein PpBr36_00436 [Pyricularia pennisetigena]|uniref:hypothetical protein n=1 Tax=Pyricularia pennisetigena TaxID=1578925 RepID=UPI00114D6472|nr:hypothetical protein PpBr36_00436 [Pyricularia pennisetigena]TLS29543.1 hypothetical protein PpBr36_00436 [Pyricularia pennisetigena]
MGDRPEPGLIKWYPSATRDYFLHVSLQNPRVDIYQPTGHARNGAFDRKKLFTYDNIPLLTTYDWSPTLPDILAVGNSSGDVNILRIDGESKAMSAIRPRAPRTCQAVAFNTNGKLAVGLERARGDHSLYVWDVSQLDSITQASPRGLPDNLKFPDPVYKNEMGVSVSSVKFFEDNPNTLVIGAKRDGLRIHDLRDPSSGATTFRTHCCNNLAIDYADPNYFASSVLDNPGIMVWDRRATSRFHASPSYTTATEDQPSFPWGGALQLNNALGLESDDSLGDITTSFIRSMRYCRDRRGMLAVLSRTGQLKVMSTSPERLDETYRVEGSPELLEVNKSNEMDSKFLDPTKQNERIVSFDWVTNANAAQQPRLLVLRANSDFEILEVPSFTNSYPYKLSPWQAPNRGLETSGDHHDLVQFEPQEAREILAPKIMQDALSEIPLFQEPKPDAQAVVANVLQSPFHGGYHLKDLEAEGSPPLPDSFRTATTVAEKLRILREYAKNTLPSKGLQRSIPSRNTDKSLNPLTHEGEHPITYRERHEQLLATTMFTLGFPSEAQLFIDHVMLWRAKEMYLFDCERNRKIVADDPWLRDTWAWIAGAEDAAQDSGMTAAPLDLSYMGVATIWFSDLGNKPLNRLVDGGAALPDSAAWERSISAICSKQALPKFDGAETKKVHHRRLCLAICGWGRSGTSDLLEFEETPASEKTSTWHTMTTAHALFKGETKNAIKLLKRASAEHPELMFVSLALQLMMRGDNDLAKEHLDFDENIASQKDPYLRAISSLIATRGWLTIANQRSLPLRERAYVAVRYLNDEELSQWLTAEVRDVTETGDISGIVLTGITDNMVEILAKYVQKFHDVQSAILIMSICAPRYVEDYRCAAWRRAYRAYLQRHKAYFQRTKFEVESTKKSKRDGQPTIAPPFRQIALRCIYCDAEMSMSRGAAVVAPTSAPGLEQQNPLTAKMVSAGISCPTCKRHLPRCVVCLEIVGMPRSDKPEASTDPEVKLAARFPTFCLKCEHVLHLDHARQWFARHAECPVPECRCQCNFRANPELNYK